MLERAMVTPRVVARLAEDRLRRPRAAREALLGVVAAAAVSPQIVDRTIARVAHRRRALPDVTELVLADVAAGPRRRAERWAALDRSVGLDAQTRAPHPAGRHVALREGAFQLALDRTEVADVVARPEQHARLATAIGELPEHRKQLEHVVRLKQNVRLVGGAAHRNGELDLPAVDAVR